MEREGDGIARRKEEKRKGGGEEKQGWGGKREVLTGKRAPASKTTHPAPGEADQ